MKEDMGLCSHNRNKQPSVLLVTAVFPPEPVVSANLAYDIALRLHQNGNHVVVVSPKPSRPLNYVFPKDQKLLPFEHKVLESYICPPSKIIGRFRESISFGRATKKYIKRHHGEIDVIYANTWPLFAQYYLAKEARKYNIPYYINVQDVYPEQFKKRVPPIVGKVISACLLPIDRYVLRHAKGVVAISPSMQKYLVESRSLDCERVHVVRNWQDDTIFEESYKDISQSDIRPTHFMFLGSINPTVDLEYVLDAFSQVDKDSYTLSIIGNGSSKDSCISKASELGVNAFFGAVTPNEVPNKQSEADVLILSLQKGVAKTATPSKLTAYLYSGRPVIACVDTDSDTAKIIKNSGCGLVVPSGDTDGLISAINSMSALSIEEKNQMGKQGLDYARKELSRQKNLQKVTDIIMSNS